MDPQTTHDWPRCACGYCSRRRDGSEIPENETVARYIGECFSGASVPDATTHAIPCPIKAIVLSEVS